MSARVCPSCSAAPVQVHGRCRKCDEYQEWNDSYEYPVENEPRCQWCGGPVSRGGWCHDMDCLTGTKRVSA